MVKSQWPKTEKSWFWSWQEGFIFGCARTGRVTCLSASKTQIGASDNVSRVSTLGTKITTNRRKRTGRTTKSRSAIRHRRGKGKFGAGSLLFLLKSLKPGCGSFLSLLNFWGVRFIVGQIITYVFLNRGPTKFWFIRWFNYLLSVIKQRNTFTDSIPPSPCQCSHSPKPSPRQNSSWSPYGWS